ncbi:MAG: hypothetical protein JWO09_3341 [Bacteroidetes bacterium]|nr:hypothetical protein [Bacteroidota bacterium]
MFKNKPYFFSRLTIAFIVCASVLLVWFFRWEDDKYLYIVDGDGADYYSYLVSIFINQDLGAQDLSPWYIIPTATGTINVHPLGVSLLLSPFFGIGYICSTIIDADLNGLSEPFLKMVSVGALFYLTLGLYFLRRLLAEFNFSDKVIAITLLLVFFGTNLLNYAIIEPSMAHVYSFAMISAFLFYAKKLFAQFSRKHLYLAALLFALVILIRPVNGIIIFTLPFLAGSFSNFKTVLAAFFRDKRALIVSALIFFSVLFIQSAVWYAQNGQFIQWSYKGNGFYFSDPHTWLMLFGFDSGFFIYTPLCLLVLLGLIPLFKENRFRFWILSGFLAFSFYLFSCYWGYTYFDGLGIRTFVDYYALFAVLLAMLLTYIAKKWIKFMAVPALMSASLISLVFCFQYQAGILPAAGMNYNKFRYIFLNTDESYAGVLGGCMDLAPYADADTPPEMIYSSDQKQAVDLKDTEYGLLNDINPLKISSNKLYVKISLERKEEALNSSQEAMVVVHLQKENGESKSYQAFKINEVPADTCCAWEAFNYRVTIADKVVPGDKLGIYIWNKAKQSFSIQNFNVEVYNYNFKTS